MHAPNTKQPENQDTKTEAGEKEKIVDRISKSTAEY